MARIAVENSLSNVKDALQNNGHEVLQLDEQSLQSCDCCVISGQDQNVMGIANAETRASVINAQGLTTEEIIQQVNQRTFS
jgi:hypothetical protein